MSTKSRAVSAKGVEEFKTYITRALPLNAVITCADNTGAKTLRIIMVSKAKTRLRLTSGVNVGQRRAGRKTASAFRPRSSSRRSS